ncbi:ABC transporter substrate-binding protein [Pararobbsia silviterrae]|nr:extracellular solute-binding protein [Pararobbsia silviterrae]
MRWSCFKKPLSFAAHVWAAIGAALFAFSACAPAHAEDTLRVLAWPGYADETTVKAFEARYHAKVEVTVVDSDEALHAQLNPGTASTGPFDVLAANTAEIERYTREQVLAPLDLAALPNTQHQLPRFRALSSIDGLTSGTRAYGIPFTYSSMGLIYDRKQIPVAPRSMNALWDPRYQGKVLTFDSAQHNYSFTALALGYHDPFDLDAAQMRTVTHRLIALRRNLLTYYTVPEDAASLFVEHKVALMFGNYGNQQVELLRRAGADVGYVIPDEGALAWLDCWAMTRASKHPQLALEWIDFMIGPDVARRFTQREGLANTVFASTDADASARLYWIRPVEDGAQREALWNRIVSGDRPETFR